MTLEEAKSQTKIGQIWHDILLNTNVKVIGCFEDKVEIQYIQSHYGKVKVTISKDYFVESFRLLPTSAIQ